MSNTADEEQPLLSHRSDGSETTRKKEKKKNWVKWGVMTATVSLWFGLGIWVGCMIEGWSFITALYVMVQIITTIGYGDILIERQMMKLWIALYVLLGVMVLAGLVSNMTADLLAKQEKSLKRHFKRIHAKVSGKTEEAPPTESSKAIFKLGTSFVLFLIFLAAGTIFYATYEQCSCSYGRTRIDGCEEYTDVPLGVADVEELGMVKEGVSKLNIVKDFEKCAATGGQIKTWIDSFYMSVVTLTTVGFGDHSPKSYYGRWFSIFWMLFGVVATANFIGATSEFILAREGEGRRLERISEDVFAKIDFDKDGSISRAEFRNYAFLQFEMIKEDDLQRVDAIFEGIDADKNGYLTFEECQMYFGKGPVEK